MSKIGRNDLCPCQSGKKYKKCCGAPAKPTGQTGLIALTYTSEGLKTNIQNIEYPRRKDQIEKMIVDGFLRSAGLAGMFGGERVEAVQNEENHFDFTLHFESGRTKFLELMEAADLQSSSGSYEDASTSYNAYEFADQIFKNIQKKSKRYGAATKDVSLLLYVTDFKFALHERVVELLQYWSATVAHVFEAIDCYSPMPITEGIIQALFPSSRRDWQDFDAQSYRNIQIHSLLLPNAGRHANDLSQ